VKLSVGCCQVMQDIVAHMILDPHSNTYDLHYILDHQEVCQEAYFFLRYGGCDKATQRRIMAKVHSGCQQYKANPTAHFAGCIKKDGLKSQQVRADILHLCKLYGEEQVCACPTPTCAPHL
jgi:hypothetical protein